MKCEICHQADAATVVHVTKDGEKRELYVCKSCAAAVKRPRHTTEKPGRSSGTISPGKLTLSIQGIGPNGDTPPPFVEDLLKATLGFMHGLEEKERKSKAVCPTCHATWAEIEEHGRLGCPSCWKTFAKQIRETFLREQYGPRHIGGMPNDVTGEASRTFLERELKAAVSRQDFEKAAELRRKLDMLGDAPEGGTR